jgi:hypothetical protein
MKLQTLFIVGGSLYLLSKLRESQAEEARAEGLGLNTTLAPGILSGQLSVPVPDRAAVRDTRAAQASELTDRVSSARLRSLFNAVNYYAALAEKIGANTRLVPLKSWDLDGNFIRFTDRSGWTSKMSYPEWSSFVNSNARPIAALTGDWSHYPGD